jgi:hypothetical protein
LEESFEGTQAMKGAKTYILNEKFASFKIMRMYRRCFIGFKCFSMISKHLEKK